VTGPEANGSKPVIAVIDYGIGNLRSAQKALDHVGAQAHLTSDSDLIASADGVVLPGVGAFGACMNALRSDGLDADVFAAVASGRPFLGICVGMQMLFEGSEESPDIGGLGILPGTVRWLPESVKRPQMQWNRLTLTVEERHGSMAEEMLVGLDGTWMYFVHSLAAEVGPDTVATVEYGGPVAAAVARGNVFATQFHPEKSARPGLGLLRNFVSVCRKSDAGRPAGSEAIAS